MVARSDMIFFTKFHENPSVGSKCVTERYHMLTFLAKGHQAKIISRNAYVPPKSPPKSGSWKTGFAQMIVVSRTRVISTSVVEGILETGVRMNCSEVILRSAVAVKLVIVFKYYNYHKKSCLIISRHCHALFHRS
jgi:hypothetical protein